MAQILPRDLPAAGSVNTSSAIIIDDGSGVKKATPAQLVSSGFPVASQAEAEAGVVSDKAMTPQRVSQAIDALGVSQAVLASTAGAAQVGFIQSGTGATARTVGEKLEDFPIYPEDYFDPADPDDTLSIQRMLAYAASSGRPYRGRPKTYAISDEIVITSSGDLSDATFEVDATAVPRAILIGSTGTTPDDLYARLNVALPEVINTAKTTTGWSGFDASVGVEIANVRESVIRLKKINGFGVGVRCSGYAAGFSYNDVFVGLLLDNKVNMLLQPGDDNGWVNENNFIGGRYAFSTAEGTNVSGTRHIQMLESSASAVNAPPNNNVFLKPSIEGNTPEYHVDIQGSFNKIINGRWEATTPKVRYYSRTSSQTNSNAIDGGYQAQNIAFTEAGSTSLYNGVISPRYSVLYGSGITLQISNASSASIAGRHIVGYATASPQTKGFSSTDWAYILYAQGLAGKQAADAAPRVILNYTNGRFFFGPGGSDPTKWVGNNGSSCGFGGADFLPDADNSRNNGSSSARYAATYSREFRPGSGAPIWTSGSGTPEGAVTAPVGSLYTRTDGGAATTLYVKESGATGNTGWVAK